MDKPSPVPTEDYIANLWEAVTVGGITWRELVQLQAGAMPRCEAHTAPTGVTIGGVPMCEVCLKAYFERGHHAGT